MTGLEEDLVTRGRAYLETLVGRPVAVVGLARSGVAAARLLHASGARVSASDTKPLERLGERLIEDARGLTELGIRFVTDDAVGEGVDGAELVVVSPGVPLDAPQLAPARRAGVPIIGEIELAWRALEADTIAITGTNGKTTTTALTGEILAGHYHAVLVAGNIGRPLAGDALGFPPDGMVVCEVSSFQLETIEAFQPRIAAVLNVTPDHLDRHRTFEAYLDAKARIFMNQTSSDCAVLNADDAPARSLAERTQADVVWFSRKRPVDHGVFVRDGWVVAKLRAGVEAICPLTDIFLPGQHNVENVLAATACALWCGLPAETIRRGIAGFRGVPHRIELVRELRGVRYYNDSKGTNVASTIKALESFSEPIVLIAGGIGKGQDFAPLAAAARGRVRQAVVLGEDGPKIATALETVGVPVRSAATMESVLHAARDAAAPGDIVLLSPACASFDMFDHYEHRGDVFRTLVESLA